MYVRKEVVQLLLGHLAMRRNRDTIKEVKVLEYSGRLLGNCYQLPVTSYQLPVTSYQLPTSALEESGIQLPKGREAMSSSMH